MFGKFRALVAIAFAAALLVFAPATARASGGWPWPVDGPVLLGYGASYVNAQGKTCTHGGVDVGAPAGTGVHASVAGQVSFAGLVPAGDGERAYAVTVLTSDGLRVTYLPLRTVAVKRGESVAAGDGLGSLAEGGDASSASSHLHIGVHRGDADLDPLSFLGAVGGSPSAPEAPPSAAKASSPGLPVGSKSASHATARPAPAQSAVPAPAQVPAASGAPRTAPSLQDAIRTATAVSSQSVARTPVLTRIGQVGGAPMLDVARMSADVRSGRGWLVSLLTHVGLAGLAVGCVIPVLRGAGSSMAARSTQAAVARRAGR